MSLSSLSHRCRQESERFFNRQEYDPRFCYELFRRAIMERNELAWERIYTQYERLVSHWVKRHAAFPTSGEEADFFVTEAYAKLWSGITPERFGTFPDLKSILRYLQMCVHSVLVDFVRSKEFKLKVDQEEALTPLPDTGKPTLEARVISKITAQELYSWLQTQLQDEREACVVYSMFVLAMKPREVAEQYQDVFTDVKEVYRVKENLLARLRRNDWLTQLFENA
ncbi:MAG: hypothetical protein WAM60_16430 [Candidatus Promineifilaceae bacterium]